MVCSGMLTPDPSAVTYVRAGMFVAKVAQAGGRIHSSISIFPIGPLPKTPMHNIPTFIHSLDISEGATETVITRLQEIGSQWTISNELSCCKLPEITEISTSRYRYLLNL
jgi:hypothetical protein